MKFIDMSFASVRPGDAPLVIEAIDTLSRQGVDVRRPEGNPHHLKVSPTVSYYATTGRIVPDGRRALARRGLDALIQALAEGLE